MRNSTVVTLMLILILAIWTTGTLNFDSMLQVFVTFIMYLVLFKVATSFISKKFRRMSRR